MALDTSRSGGSVSICPLAAHRRLRPQCHVVCHAQAATKLDGSALPLPAMPKRCHGRASADERQAERDVDAVLEGQRLGRDQRLVVIHAQRRVVAGARLAWNIVSAGSGPVAPDALGAQLRYRGRDDRDVLAAHGPAFARMRIEPGDRQPRLRDAEARRRIVRPYARGIDDKRCAANACGTSASAMWMVTGTVRSRVARDHHHRQHALLPVFSRASSARNSVWPGWKNRRHRALPWRSGR